MRTDGGTERRRGEATKNARVLSPSLCLSVFLPFLCSPLTAAEPNRVIVVVGAAGTEEFGEQFRTWAGRWQAAAEKGGAAFTAIGLAAEGDQPDRELLAAALSAGEGSSAPLWLVLIGHGTFDSKAARFNLRGPDVSAAELAALLKPLARPAAIVNCTSSSGPFLAELSGPGRVVITATRSGHEYNFARLGDYLSAAIADPQADLDKDDQTSLLEALLLASAGLKEFYTREARLATEHALVDDNGDKLGTPPDWFRGVRAVKTAKDGAAPDGITAAQWILVKSSREADLDPAARARRDELEQDLAALRQRKARLSEDEYLKLLEPLLVELAKLYSPSETPTSPESGNMSSH